MVSVTAYSTVLYALLAVKITVFYSSSSMQSMRSTGSQIKIQGVKMGRIRVGFRD